MAFLVQAVTQALTAGGGAGGTLTIADTAGYVAGAYAWLSNSAVADSGRRVRIARVVSSTVLEARFDERIDEQGFKDGSGYPSNQALSDFSAYPITTGAISQPEQVVPGKRNDLDALDRA